MYNSAFLGLDQIQRFSNNITQYRVIKHVYIQHTKKTYKRWNQDYTEKTKINIQDYINAADLPECDPILLFSPEQA